MKKILPGGTFVKNGAIVLDPIEHKTIVHALIEERDRVLRTGGDHYGEMTIAEFGKLVAEMAV